MSKGSQNWFVRLMGSDLAPFWGTMTRNWILKLVCLGLAVVVWQEIRDSTSFEVEVTDVPVVILPGAGHAVLDQSTDVVSVRFRGTQEDLRFINRDQLSLEINLSEEPQRLRQSVRFVPRFLRAPSRAHAVEFYPEEVLVTLDREVERALPVKATFEGELPEGVQLEKAVCEPASVRVRGAERRVLELEQVHAQPILLEGRYSSFQAHASVAANGQPWTIDPERVSVQVELVERIANRRFAQKRVRALLSSEDSRTVRIRPEKVDVTLKGTPERLSGLNPQDVSVYVDCTELTEPADYEVPVRINLPPGVKVDKIEPPVVQVGVKNI
jgi:hypothetical protein